ncbi:MAG: asparagine synthase (glutamine-hydrolyzing) [Bacteroidota bacterium]|nr:asparagine synthase (glutamine-hydrolyzing) [Bacteroidota bacterium]
MCGIAGIIHTDDRHGSPSRKILTAMIHTIRHRGPDEFGIYRDQYAGLGHARLSLIDLATGQQPMTNEDESLWIVFNGEIFNYLELRSELEKRGHRFRTHSDTEVILHAYETWGNDCFNKFNGQWAVALWNSRERSLILSRDRVGVRPLFIHQGHGRILFASEVKALFADPNVPREIDARGLDQTFTYWSPIAPTTMFKQIEAIVPGSVRTYRRDGTHTDELYWQMSFHERPFHSLREASEQLREHLDRATRLRILRADVPVGSYLSGGLDSSLVAKMGRNAKEGIFRTFSLRFDDAEYDETSYQRMMAETLDSNHAEIVVSRYDIARVFPDVIRHTEQPILRTAPAPLYLLSKLVREAGIKAVLTGEGADEMFAGYDLFREAKVRMFWSHQPDSQCRPRLFDRLYPYLARSPQSTKGMALEFWKQGLSDAGTPGFSHDPRWRTTSALKRFFSSEIKDSLLRHPAPSILDSLPLEFNRWDELAQAQYIEIATLLSGYLLSAQGDRMLMAHSVEGRFPFLDADVIEFSASLSAGYKLFGLDEKKIVKEAARTLIPDPIIQRQKQPYRAPDAASFVGDKVPEYVEEMLSENALRAANMFMPKSVRGLFAKCKQKGSNDLFSNSDNMALVGILSAQLMFHQMIAGPRHDNNTELDFTTDINIFTNDVENTIQ